MNNERRPGHSHGVVNNESGAATHAAYDHELRHSHPAPGRRILSLELEASEIEWEYSPGRPSRAWAYNRQVPGPVLEGQVGDLLEVRLRNSLPESTTLHWHGLRLPAAMDGTEDAQRPTPPGETFVYRFALPDAGLFWYHPHVNEPVQIERGLYGALVVRTPEEPVLDAERVLLFHEMSVEEPMGQHAVLRLINGRQEPVLNVAAGQIERWRIANVSNGRYVRLSIGGQPFQILGTDGGLIQSPYRANEVLLAPADRVDLAVGPFPEGATFPVESLAYHAGTMASENRTRFATLRVGKSLPSRARIPDTLRSPIEPLVKGPVASTRRIRLGMITTGEGVAFTVNEETHHRDLPVRIGQLEVWDLVNETNGDHPFHLHGFFFQVVEVNGVPPDFLSWEDTINVPARGRVRIAWIANDHPGDWMYHCHILDHHALGMMAHFEVIR